LMEDVERSSLEEVVEACLNTITAAHYLCFRCH